MAPCEQENLSIKSTALALFFPLRPSRIKNGQLLKEDYRIKQLSDALVIHGVTELDAGNYTIFLSNKVTKEEQKRDFQLLVNGNFQLFIYFSFSLFLMLPNAVD